MVERKGEDGGKGVWCLEFGQTDGSNSTEIGKIAKGREGKGRVENRRRGEERREDRGSVVWWSEVAPFPTVALGCMLETNYIWMERIIAFFFLPVSSAL